MIKALNSKEPFTTKLLIALIILIPLITLAIPAHAKTNTQTQSKDPPNIGYVKYTLDLCNNTLLNGNVANIMCNAEPWGLAYDPVNGYVYVTDSWYNIVYVINPSMNKVIGKIQVGIEPLFIIYDPSNGYLYVSNYGSNSSVNNLTSFTISVINPSTNKVIANITEVGLGSPAGLAYDPSNGYIYVAQSITSIISVINPSTNQLINIIEVGTGPWDIIYDPSNGYLYVTNWISNTVSVIDPVTNTVIANIIVGQNPSGITYDSSNGYIYVANHGSNTVSVINPLTNQVITNIAVGASPEWIMYDPSNGYIYVTDSGSNTVTVINPATNTVIGNITVGQRPMGIVYDPSNGYLYVANWGSGTISIIATANETAEYSVTFIESGLPSGTPWSVTINGTTKTSITNEITFTLPPGTYTYMVNPVPGYTASPSSGTITVSGNETISIKFTPVTYGVVVNVFNVNGKPATTVPGIAYGLLVNDTTKSVVAMAYLNSNSQLVFSNVPPGNYTLLVFHYPNSELNATEFWGSMYVSAVAGETTVYNFTRYMPWIYNVESSPNTNGTYTLTIVLNNTLTTQVFGNVYLYISPNMSFTNSLNVTIGTTLNPGLNTVTYLFKPPGPGTYYVYVVLSTNGIVTDQYNWTRVASITSMKTLLNLSILINGTLIKNQTLYISINSSTAYTIHTYASYSTTINPVTLNVTVTINGTASQSIVTSITFAPPITGVGKDLYFTIPLSIRLPNGEVKTIYVNVTLSLFVNYITTGSIVVNIHNVNGEPATTVPGVVYGLLVNATNMHVVAMAYMNSNSQLIFSNVQPGTYTLYVYHYPNTGLNETEYWGNLTVTVTAGQTSTYNFIRDMPWIKNVQATYIGNDKYEITVTVINPQSTPISGRVFLYVSPNENFANAAELINYVTYEPGTNEFTFTYTLTTTGTYYAYVMIDAYVNQYWGEPTPTDQYNWAPIFTTPIILVGNAVINNNKIYLTGETETPYANGAVFWQSYFNNNEAINIAIVGNVSFSGGSIPGDGFVFYLFLNPSNWGIEPQYNHTMIPHNQTDLSISPVMGEVLFPQSKTPYIVVQWDPIWQDFYRQVGVVGQWNVWIIGPNGHVIKAWNGIGVGSINLTDLSKPSLLPINISYDPSTNTLMGMVTTIDTLGNVEMSFFVLNLNGYFTPPSSNNYIFGVGAATGLHYGKWYLLIQYNRYNIANYIDYAQGFNSVLARLKNLIIGALYGVGLPGQDIVQLDTIPSLVSVNFSQITNYIVVVNIGDYTSNGVTYVPIPSQLTINLTDLLWPQEAYTGGAGFGFVTSWSSIYVVFIPQSNLEYSVIVSNWNPFIDMYSYANYGTSYSPDGNCYGLSSTAILYFEHKITYPLQDYGPTSEPTVTAQLYLGQEESIAGAPDLIISPPQYPLTPASLEIAIHQIFDPNINIILVKSKQLLLQANDFNDLKKYLSEGLPVVLVLWSTFGSGHAVVAWGYAKLANGSYAILISDPDFPGTIRVAIYTPNAVLGYFSSFKYVWPDGTTYNYFYVIEPTPAKWSWFIEYVLTRSLLYYYLLPLLLLDLTKGLSPYTLIVVHANSPSSNAKVYLLSNSSMYDTFTQWGNTQSFVGYIPGSTGVFDGDVEVFAIPNQYDGDLVIDPVGSTVGVFIMQVENSTVKGFLVNATSTKPINVTISLKPTGLVVVSNSSAELNVTGFYMNKTKVVTNSTVMVLEPSKPATVNSSALIGVPWASLTSSSTVTSTSTSTTTSTSGTSTTTTTSSNTVSATSSNSLEVEEASAIIITAAIIAALMILLAAIRRRH